MDEIELEPIEIEGLEEKKPKTRPKNPFELRNYYKPRPSPTPTESLKIDPLEVDGIELEPVEELKLED